MRALAAAGLCLVIAGCASHSERYDAAAREHSLHRRELSGGEFRLAVFAPPAPAPGPLLHVYLEGDGTPLIRGRRPSAEPTPRRPLMPALMALDPAPRLLLGRPCYHGLAATPPCRPRDWAEGRFAEAVVDSMAAAVRRLAGEGGHEGVVLIGHSGGGVLALLIAERVAEVRAVVAVATVADIGAWTRHHGLVPLAASLNPTERISKAGPPELFLAGGRDRVTPLALVRDAAAGRPRAQLRVYPGFDHACCWSEAWPEVLAWIVQHR